MLPALAQAAAVVAESPLLPGDDGARLDERQGVLPAWSEPGQPRPGHTVGRTESRAMDHRLIYRQLVPRREVFQTQGFA